MTEKDVDQATGLAPELGDELHWNNSSNVLCNYMKKQGSSGVIVGEKHPQPQ